MFRAFHLAWWTSSATKTFVAGRRNAALWLVDLPEREQICYAPSCEFDKKRATKPNLLFKVDPRSTFRNNVLQPATNVFVARQVDHTRWKTGNIDQNLQQNNVARQVEGFCIDLVFRRLHQTPRRGLQEKLCSPLPQTISLRFSALYSAIFCLLRLELLH